MKKIIKEVLELVSPLLISPDISSKKQSLTISVSRRFFLFQMLNKLVDVIEEDPHLNFIALLKNYRILGKFLNGTLKEFYRDRNNLYFKNFFIDRKLHQLVKEDIEYIYTTYPDTKDMLMTITKRGVIIYDNYKKNGFNVLLMTIHSGTWAPETVSKKLLLTERSRYKEEDIDTHKIYCGLVLEKGGIWIDNKQSRFVIDFNRGLDRSIYDDYQEEWTKKVWKEKLTAHERNEILLSHKEFYFTLSRLLDTYSFNIIFDAHSMKDLPDRPSISFGTKYSPLFYMPIVKSMQNKMIAMGYSPVLLNKPFIGGSILKWMRVKFPNVFIFSMEVNKKLYMTPNRLKTYKRKLNKISADVKKIFDIIIEDEDD